MLFFKRVVLQSILAPNNPGRFKNLRGDHVYVNGNTNVMYYVFYLSNPPKLSVFFGFPLCSPKFRHFYSVENNVFFISGGFFYSVVSCPSPWETSLLPRTPRNGPLGKFLPFVLVWLALSWHSQLTLAPEVDLSALTSLLSELASSWLYVKLAYPHVQAELWLTSRGDIT